MEANSFQRRLGDQLIPSLSIHITSNERMMMNTHELAEKLLQQPKLNIDENWPCKSVGDYSFTTLTIESDKVLIAIVNESPNDPWGENRASRVG